MHKTVQLMLDGFTDVANKRFGSYDRATREGEACDHVGRYYYELSGILELTRDEFASEVEYLTICGKRVIHLTGENGIRFEDEPLQPGGWEE
jgi:hypothetical protein